MGGISLLGDSCERGVFNLRGRWGHFLDIFQKYTFISPKCLIIQCIFVFTIVQLLQKSLQHKPDFTQESYDPSVYHKHNIYPLFWFQIQTLFLKMLFHCDSFFFYSNTIFIDVFKCNKYKKHYSMLFTFYLYIKLLKQVAKHLPPVSQTRLKTSPRLKCKSELFQLKETCTDWS